MTREEAIRHLDILRVFDAPALSEAIKMAIAALREQETVTNRNGLNDPLTFDDLAQMKGEPVWIVWPDGRIKSQWWLVGSASWYGMEFYEDRGRYGRDWIAYRQKVVEV